MSKVIQGLFVPGHAGAAAPVQRYAAVRNSAGGSAGQVLPGALPTAHSGQPLPPVVLQKMEAVFGARFHDVRVHVRPQTAALGAIALTEGSHIFFASGHYNPNSPRGHEVLAHELAHVVQQRANRVRNPFGSGVALVRDAALDGEARAIAARASVYQPGAVQRKAGPVVQRSAGAPARKRHVVSFARTPEIYEFTLQAISHGAPTALRFKANAISDVYVRSRATQLIETIKSIPAEADENNFSRVDLREVARTKVFSLGSRLGPTYGESRDECPYACTYECGTDAYWCYVPTTEQNRQGGDLRGLRLADGEEFDVVLDPPAP